MAKVLEENGHTIYFTPENTTVKHLKNYDAIIDGRLGEIKQPKSFQQIKNRLNDAEGQRASIVCIEPLMNNSPTSIEKEIRRWLNSPQKTINYVETVLLILEGNIIPIKK